VPSGFVLPEDQSCTFSNPRVAHSLAEGLQSTCEFLETESDLLRCPFKRLSWGVSCRLRRIRLQSLRVFRSRVRAGLFISKTGILSENPSELLSLNCPPDFLDEKRRPHETMSSLERGHLSLWLTYKERVATKEHYFR